MTGEPTRARPAIARAPRPEKPQGYPLGHAPRELERLALQARLVDPISERFLLQAGLAPGMRVLDLGSGVGDLSFLAAKIVGREGEVVGVDRSAAALSMARRRATTLGLGQVSFIEAEAAELPPTRDFDAVIGRYVLVFQPDPAVFLRRLAMQLRPGGKLVVHEVDFAAERSYPPLAGYDLCCRLVAEALRRSGVDPRFGLRLEETFLAAGLSAPVMSSASLVGASLDAGDLLRFKVGLLNTLLPRMQELCIDYSALGDMETLEERLAAEQRATRSVLVGRSEVGAWASPIPDP